jgi:acyl dehydratase
MPSSAAGTAYGGRIAHGALVLSIATGLRQPMGPFTGTLKGLLEIRSWKSLAPVRAGDTGTRDMPLVENQPPEAREAIEARLALAPLGGLAVHADDDGRACVAGGATGK